MPIYAYECKDCGVRFERRQNFDDAPLTLCPECEGRVHRLLQPAGIIFKGSGFYVTDNRGSRKSLNSTTKDDKPKESSKSESSSSSSSSASSSED